MLKNLRSIKSAIAVVQFANKIDTRLVNSGGNPVAQDAIAKVFTIRDRFEWR